MALKSDAKFKEKLTCGLENDKEFGKFSPEHSKVSELDFDLLSKVENVWAKNLLRSYVLWQWRMIQNFYKELTCCFKISKNCTLMDYFWSKYKIFELKKVQWSSVWWHWRLMPNPKEKPSLMLWQPSALEGNLTMDPPLLFSLAKKRIYLDTELRGELSDLFWKLPGCSLFPQAE